MELGELKQLLTEVTDGFKRIDGRISDLFEAASNNEKGIEQLRRDNDKLLALARWQAVLIWIILTAAFKLISYLLW